MIRSVPDLTLLFVIFFPQRFYKKTAAFVFKSVARHSSELAKAVVETPGALDALVTCLSDFDPSVKEASAWALGYIARHNAELAQHVVDNGAIPHLVLCLQEPELSLKRIAASTLAEICKHTPELAQVVVDQGAVSYLSGLVQHPDVKVKRQVCGCLAQIAKHSVELAEIVVEADVVTKILLCVSDPDPVVARNAATCVREICKQCVELCQLVVNAGGHTALVQYTQQHVGAARLPGVMALGFIAAFSETLSFAVIVEGGVAVLVRGVVEEEEDYMRAACCWALGQIGRHSAEHARAVCAHNGLQVLVDVVNRAHKGEGEGLNGDLYGKALRAIKAVVEVCVEVGALEVVLGCADVKVNRYVARQLCKVLVNNAAARKAFVVSGGLQKLQMLREEDDKVAADVDTIHQMYPQDIVQYYTPNYAQTLINKIE